MLTNPWLDEVKSQNTEAIEIWIGLRESTEISEFYTKNSIQVYLYSAFYDTIVAKQLYRKLSFYNIFNILLINLINYMMWRLINLINRKLIPKDHFKSLLCKADITKCSFSKKYIVW